MACLLESGLGLAERVLEFRLVIARSTLPNDRPATWVNGDFGQRGVSIANNEKARKPLLAKGSRLRAGFARNRLSQ